jgi:hypothetical protein
MAPGIRLRLRPGNQLSLLRWPASLCLLLPISRGDLQGDWILRNPGSIGAGGSRRRCGVSRCRRSGTSRIAGGRTTGLVQDPSGTERIDGAASIFAVSVARRTPCDRVAGYPTTPEEFYLRAHLPSARRSPILPHHPHALKPLVQRRIPRQPPNSARVVAVDRHKVRQRQDRRIPLHNEPLRFLQDRESLRGVRLVRRTVEQRVELRARVSAVVVPVTSTAQLQNRGRIGVVAVPAAAGDHEVAGLQVFL